MKLFSLCSLNTERDKHISKIEPFLDAHNFDVLCLSEWMDDQTVAILHKRGYQTVFTPSRSWKATKESQKRILGNCVASKFPILSASIYNYSNAGAYLETFYSDQPITQQEKLAINDTFARSLIVANLEIGDRVTPIGLTHFTWSRFFWPNGDGTFTADPTLELHDLQRVDARALAKYLDTYSDILFTADLNAPRDSEAFAIVSADMIDHVPKEVTSTIDPGHRYGYLPIDCDVLLSKGAITISDVQLHQGLSDHQGISCVVHV